MKDIGQFSVGDRVKCRVPANTVSGRHPEVVLLGEVIESAYDGGLAFRPSGLREGASGQREFVPGDPGHRFLERQGFDPESLYHDGVFGALESGGLGITFSPAP